MLSKFQNYAKKKIMVKFFQDEQGAAAILTVEIDNALNGLPVQYREVCLFMI